MPNHSSKTCIIINIPSANSDARLLVDNVFFSWKRHVNNLRTSLKVGGSNYSYS